MKQKLMVINRVLTFLVVSCLISTAVFGQDDKKEGEKVDKKADSKKIATVDMKLAPITVYETLTGVFEATQTTEIKTDFENWTDLKIAEVMEEGSQVSAGQQLIAFDTESIDKALKEAEFGLKTSEFGLKTAELEMKEIEATYTLDTSLADRTWRNAQQDDDYFKNVELPNRLKDLDYSEKSADYILEYSKDELDQLEQMYTEDELTEESEEIVLKRARRSVESAERSKDRTLRRVKRDREVSVPRDVTSRNDALKRSELAYKRSQVTLPIKKQKVELALAKAKFGHEKLVESMEELVADRKKMSLTAPASGVLYYGKSIRGKWVGGSGSPKRRLEKDKKVAAKTVVMTIVDPSQVMIRCNVSESALGRLQAGMQGTAMAQSGSKQKMPVTVKSVGRIPMDDGKYDCQIQLSGAVGKVMPGMSCKLSFLVHENSQALVAPKASVFSDDGGITNYVYVVRDEKSEKRMVEIGHTSGEVVEIVDGLTANDKISKAKPK